MRNLYGVQVGYGKDFFGVFYMADKSAILVAERVKKLLESNVSPEFHPDVYGFLKFLQKKKRAFLGITFILS